MKKEKLVTMDISVERELRQRIASVSQKTGCTEEALVAAALQYGFCYLEKEMRSLRSEQT